MLTLSTTAQLTDHVTYLLALFEITHTFQAYFKSKKKKHSYDVIFELHSAKFNPLRPDVTYQYFLWLRSKRFKDIQHSFGENVKKNFQKV